MANKFLLYRKDPAADGGIRVNRQGGEGDGVLVSHAGVVGVYDTAADVPQNPPPISGCEYVTVEYDFDPEVELTQNLILNAAEDGFDKRWPGKTKAEQIDLDIARMRDERALEMKQQHKNFITSTQSSRIEKLLGAGNWKEQKAKMQDFQAGNTQKQDALYAAIQKVHDDGNAHEGAVDALTDAAAIEAFDPSAF